LFTLQLWLAPFFKQDKWFYLDTGANSDIIQWDVESNIIAFVQKRQEYLAQLFRI
jgi:hypothetical protein